MRLSSGLHLAYCGNVHRGETWEETLAALQSFTLAVRDRVSPGQPYGIGLRLSDNASRTLVDPSTLRAFGRWLDAHNCYVFTINGFPFGQFHGARVREQVFAPDWSTPERLDYTNRLFNILAALLPADVAGSVSTLPGSFKLFNRTPEQLDAIQENLWRCIEHTARLSARSGHDLHLGVEPEPFGLFENTQETLCFFSAMKDRRPNDTRLAQHLGINYDTCHFALQYEEPAKALNAFRSHGIRISKIHLSSALRTVPDATAREMLRAFSDDTYLHQVVARTMDGALLRYKDLPLALAQNEAADEWRIHFHVPLYADPEGALQTTADHVLGTLDWLAQTPDACAHLEMETYTWEVLPSPFKTASVVDQLTREYEWVLPKLAARNLV